MPVEVAGVGMARTGTLSLKLALETLGFGPCYHMVELLHQPQGVHVWKCAFAGEAVDFEAVFAGFRSTTDFPAYGHYEALFAQYPDARFVLTTRDPERWYDSCVQTVFNAKPSLLELLSIGMRMPFSKAVRDSVEVYKLVYVDFARALDGKLTDRAHCIQRFRDHEAAVRAAIPPERLLVFEVKDGWGPLCDFLGVEAPDQPFPRTNDAADWWRKRNQGATSMLDQQPPRAMPVG